MKKVTERNKQFKKIAQLKKKYQRQRNPVVSVDTKKKEFLDIFYREGKLYTQETLESYDHNFRSFAEGVVVPYGMYDLKLNHGYLYLGTRSHDACSQHLSLTVQMRCNTRVLVSTASHPRITPYACVDRLQLTE